MRSPITNPPPVYKYDGLRLLRPSDIKNLSELFSYDYVGKTTPIDGDDYFFNYLNKQGYGQENDLIKNDGIRISPKRWNPNLIAKSRSLEVASKIGKKILANITSCRKTEGTVCRNRPESTFVRYGSLKLKLWLGAMVVDDNDGTEPSSNSQSSSLKLDHGNQNLDEMSTWCEDSDEIYEKPTPTKKLFTESYAREMSVELKSLKRVK